MSYCTYIKNAVKKRTSTYHH